MTIEQIEDKTRSELVVQDDQPPKPPSLLIARFGSYFLQVPQAASSIPQLVTELTNALDKDSRVVSVEPPDLEGQKSSDFDSYFPAQPDLENDDGVHALLYGCDERRTLSLDAPITIRVRIPVKNQRPFFPEENAPSEDYIVKWNGMVAIVYWKQTEDDWVPRAGGHVVADILARASRSVGGDLFIQACNPGCKYLFAHTSLRIKAVDSPVEFSPEPDPFQSRVYNAEIDSSDLEEASDAVFFELISPLDTFTGMKNLERRLIDLEVLTRNTLDELLSIHYVRTQTLELNRLKSLKRRWEERGWRRTSRKLLARAWYCLADIEGLKRRWTRKRLEFDRRTEQTNSLPLFDTDYTRDASLMEALDFKDLRGAIDSISTNLDNRAIVFATAGGALAGAIAGAIASGLF